MFQPKTGFWRRIYMKSLNFFRVKHNMFSLLSNDERKEIIQAFRNGIKINTSSNSIQENVGYVYREGTVEMKSESVCHNPKRDQHFNLVIKSFLLFKSRPIVL